MIGLMLLIGSASMGQEKLSKAEKKELKKQVKTLKSDLTKLKAMNEEMAALRSRVSSSEQELASSQQKVDELNTRISELEGELAAARATEKPAAPAKEPVRERAAVDQSGLSFRVQLGGYKNLNLEQFEDAAGEYVKVDPNEKGTEQITIGLFDSYTQANLFKKHLRSMGLKDAFIVPYQDGERVPLKDVVDQLDIEE